MKSLKIVFTKEIDREWPWAHKDHYDLMRDMKVFSDKGWDTYVNRNTLSATNEEYYHVPINSEVESLYEEIKNSIPVFNCTQEELAQVVMTVETVSLTEEDLKNLNRMPTELV